MLQHAEAVAEFVVKYQMQNKKIRFLSKQLAMSSFNTLLRPVVQLVGVSEDTHLEDGELPSPLVSENHEDFVSLVEL